jgi:hypothetical protein
VKIPENPNTRGVIGDSSDSNGFFAFLNVAAIFITKSPWIQNMNGQIVANSVMAIITQHALDDYLLSLHVMRPDVEVSAC